MNAPMIRGDDTKQAIHRNDRNQEFMHRHMAADIKSWPRSIWTNRAISKPENHESPPFLY
jgi:hypothetical protein